MRGICDGYWIEFGLGDELGYFYFFVVIIWVGLGLIDIKVEYL